ncbi:MAG: TusE/DsrC/DsvC family sulfur relay protein [Gammaproteobacteria bacterium]|jgi:tRNA 2-thiouridine synthesizing protein E
MIHSKTINNDPQTSSPIKEDRLIELQDWSRDKAEGIAVEEGIKMEEAHWQVVTFLRNYYLENGKADSGRELADALNEAFKDQGGGVYLHTLFPEGPVAQGSRIAGLQVPAFTEDKSFGSVM